ncbi:MAG: DUF1636 domain-containing protein [Sphingomonadaceae bacterium]
MLVRAADGPAIVACNTCRRARDTARSGAQLVAALRAVQASDPRYAAVTVQEMSCLFACGDACTLHLRAPGKIGYVLGRFTADEDSARAILDYAVHYAASADGEVPFALWPEGVKGHFLTRMPPPGFLVAD